MSGRSPVDDLGAAVTRLAQTEAVLGRRRAGENGSWRGGSYIVSGVNWVSAGLGSADVFGDAGEEVWVLEAFAVAFCDFPCSFAVKAFLVEGPMKR